MHIIINVYLPLPSTGIATCNIYILTPVDLRAEAMPTGVTDRPRRAAGIYTVHLVNFISTLSEKCGDVYATGFLKAPGSRCTSS